MIDLRNFLYKLLIKIQNAYLLTKLYIYVTFFLPARHAPLEYTQLHKPRRMQFKYISADIGHPERFQ